MQIWQIKEYFIKTAKLRENDTVNCKMIFPSMINFIRERTRQGIMQNLYELLFFHSVAQIKMNQSDFML
jgi:hypothetical protein